MKYITVLIESGAKQIHPSEQLFKQLCSCDLYMIKDMYQEVEYQDTTLNHHFFWVDNKNKSIIEIFPNKNYDYGKIITHTDINIDKLLKANKNELMKIEKSFVPAYTAGAFHKFFNKEVDDLILHMSIPEKFKKVSNPFIYRGLRLNQKAIDKLDNNETIKLKPRPLTSWSTDINIAKSFTKDNITGLKGCIIRMPVSKANVILSLDTILICDFYWREHEVLVKGNGVDEINMGDVYQTSWKESSFGQKEDKKIYEMFKPLYDKVQKYYTKIKSNYPRARLNISKGTTGNPSNPTYYSDVEIDLGIDKSNISFEQLNSNIQELLDIYINDNGKVFNENGFHQITLSNLEDSDPDDNYVLTFYMVS